ncbi:EamA family transporter [Streptomyces sp. NPDC000994]
MAGKVPASGLVLAGVCGIQFGAALAPRVYPQVGSAGVVFLRLLIAAVLLCVMWRPRRAALGRMKGAWPAMLGAGTLLVGHHIAFFAAVEKNVPLGVVATIEFLGPFTIALGASRRLADLVPACVAAGGVALLSQGGTASLPLSGVVLAALAACCWASVVADHSDVDGVGVGIDPAEHIPVHSVRRNL